MKDVREIIENVYGSQAEAAVTLKVVPGAVGNWISRGNFPPRLLLRIGQDAMSKGVSLTLSDIPVIPPPPGQLRRKRRRA